MRVAIYRVLYGEDYIAESIQSILPIVDRVVVAKAERPWGSSSGVAWKGEWVPWPEKFDETRERVAGLKDPRVEVIDDYWPEPKNQHQHLVNDIVLPKYNADEVIFIEPDHVFTDAERKLAIDEWLDCGHRQATTRMIELWRTPDWRIAERHRPSVIFQNIGRRPMRETSGDGGQNGVSSMWLKAQVHNFGFAMSARTTYWKHLTATAFADEIRDAPPDPKWLEDKWLNWTPETRDLEISLGGQHTIPFAVRYDRALAPLNAVERCDHLASEPRFKIPSK